MIDQTKTVLQYPHTPHDEVVDDYHGTPVADPYRWLEDAENPATQAWVAEQNRLTRIYLDAIPAREKIRQRLTHLWNYPRYSVPRKEGERYFFFKNDGLQDQNVLYMQPSLDGEPVEVIDPNKLSEDGTVALTNYAVSHDGRLIAYTTSQAGSDWQEIRIRDVDTGQEYPEVLQWCKFTSIAWTRDRAGFFYNRFPEPHRVSEEEQTFHNRVYWHQPGTPQAQDRLVYERPDARELMFFPQVTEDGQFLILHAMHGTDPENRVYYKRLAGDGEVVRLLDEADAKYIFIDNIGSTFFFHTDQEASRGRIIAIDIEQPDPAHWREIIPQHEEDVIAFVTLANEHFVVGYMHDAHHRLRIFDLAGHFIREIELPTIGSVVGLSGKRTEKTLFLGFQSFLYPTTIFYYDLDTDTLTPFHEPALDFDPSAYETRQVFYTSKDGTRIPMFLTHKKGLVPHGEHPILLYGYGGFEVSLTPIFSVSQLVWLENGGVFAVPNLRGGGEYGDAWHRAGMLEKKQNVFDDFIAAAEWLIQTGYTRPEKLAIMGGSNGGLLVAACMVQRPELFGAVICRVPVIDMLRYHKFTVGRFWVGEYGNAEENPEHFAFLYAYSPLHNIQPGVVYPPTLITTADTDDRVVPAHAKKFAAALQAAQAGTNPILLRVETKAGHGLGKPTSKMIEELADMYAFLFHQFDISIG